MSFGGPQGGHFVQTAFAVNYTKPGSLWMQKDSITAHLVNLTNPMMMRGPVWEIPPAPPRVQIRVPEGKRLQKASLLVSAKSPGHRINGNVGTLEIPSIELHEVVRST